MESLLCAFTLVDELKAIASTNTVDCLRIRFVKRVGFIRLKIKRIHRKQLNEKDAVRKIVQ